MADKAIKVSSKDFEVIQAVIDHYGLEGKGAQKDALSLIINEYNNKVKSESKERKTPKSFDRLHDLWKAIEKHNLEQKDKEGLFIYGFSTYWLQQQIYMNGRRDIKPFFETISRQYEAHGREIGIKGEYTMHPKILEKGDDGRSLFFVDFLNKNELSDLFKKRK